METTRQAVTRLALEYLGSSNYHIDEMSKDWAKKITKELNLVKLSDWELCNVYDMAQLTLNERCLLSANDNHVEFAKWNDAKNAFDKVIKFEMSKRNS